jgi:hypothetical protein
MPGTSLADTLLIGTGPPMLLHGLSLAEAGHRVIFVDAADRIGGAWKTRTVFGFRHVEAGVHLIENRAYLNRAVENLLGPDRLVRGPPDFGLVLGRRVPMPLARIALYGLVAGKSALRGRREKILHSLRNFGLSLRYAGLPLVYPAGGAAEMLAATADRLARAGARFRFETRIERIVLDGNGIAAVTADGALRAGHLVMSSRAHAPIAGLEPLWTDCERVTTHSYMLHLAGPLAPFEGYVEVVGDTTIKRARNVTGFACPRPPPGETLLTVQLRRPPDGPERAGTTICRRMAELGLLDPATRLLGFASDEVTLVTLGSAALGHIAAAHPRRLTALRTVDLGDRAYDVRPVVAPDETQVGA